ncbi:metallophosphoesterase family protein [Alteribacter populi]|uniref:metallophosphoesterase family protein n=1 Tax=Alteribacter populi TaxID=2011011 RepID=UPI000BBA7D0E|nr:metallophosphoesterase [Alteribacter populi]
MKFLYFTDTHIRGSAPKNRLDAFTETLKEKIEEVIEEANNKDVDFILHGGDVFDRPDLSPNTVGQFAKQFRKAKAPIYTVAGNHDTYGHNPKTIDRTMLGLLDAFGLIHVIEPDEPVLVEGDNVKVQISAQPYHYDLDQRDIRLDYYPENQTGADKLIHLVHGMLVEKKLPEGIPYTLVDQMWNTTADVLLTGHFHGGFGLKEQEGKWIANPGAIARVNNHWSELIRMPKYIIGEITKEGTTLTEHQIRCAKKGEDVLDRTFLEKASQNEEKLHEFVQQVREHADFQTLNIGDIINEIASNRQVDEPVRGEALRRITIVQERWEGGDNETD